MSDKAKREERRRLVRWLIPQLRSLCGISTRQAERAAPYLADTLAHSAWLAEHDRRLRTSTYNSSPRSGGNP